ncbi:MAG: hypothetical protein Q9179_007863, partial [Wetmoreana sp. 5 TL-2023]
FVPSAHKYINRAIRKRRATQTALDGMQDDDYRAIPVRHTVRKQCSKLFRKAVAEQRVSERFGLTHRPSKHSCKVSIYYVKAFGACPDHQMKLDELDDDERQALGLWKKIWSSIFAGNCPTTTIYTKNKPYEIVDLLSAMIDRAVANDAQREIPPGQTEFVHRTYDLSELTDNITKTGNDPLYQSVIEYFNSALDDGVTYTDTGKGTGGAKKGK